MPVIIPLTIDASQSETILGFDLLIQWNIRDNAWRMDISQNNILLIAGVKLTAGVALLSPYALQIGDFFVYQNSTTLIDPTRDGFVTGQFLLIYLTQEEVNGLLASS